MWSIIFTCTIAIIVAGVVLIVIVVVLLALVVVVVVVVVVFSVVEGVVSPSARDSTSIYSSLSSNRCVFYSLDCVNIYIYIYIYFFFCILFEDFFLFGGLVFCGFATLWLT